MKKNKIILNLFALLFLIATVAINSNIVYGAGSFSVSGGGTVSNGGDQKTITITTKDCGGAFSITVSGGGSISGSAIYDTNKIFVDGSESFTVTAPASGSTTVTVTPIDLVSSDFSYVTGAKSVTVTVEEVVVEPTPTPSTPTVTLSSNNNLSDLTVAEGEFSPEFSYGTTEYSLTLWDVDRITINATKDHSDATISGTGEHAVVSGENEFDIIVTAENGSKKTYTIYVTIKESPTIFLPFGGEELGVVKELDDVIGPDGFEKTTVMIAGEEVAAWTSNLLGMTGIYLIDEEGNQDFYLYNEETAVVSYFRALGLLGRNVYIVDISEELQFKEGMVYELVSVEGNLMYGWTFEDVKLADYYLIYVMNDTGKLVTYLYCKSDNSMILAPDIAAISWDVYYELLSTNSSLTTEVEAFEDEQNILENNIVQMEGEMEQMEEKINVFVYIGIGLGVLLFIFLILYIKAKIKYRKLSEKYNEVSATGSGMVLGKEEEMDQSEDETVQIVEDETVQIVEEENDEFDVLDIEYEEENQSQVEGEICIDFDDEHKVDINPNEDIQIDDIKLNEDIQIENESDKNKDIQTENESDKNKDIQIEDVGNQILNASDSYEIFDVD